MFLLASIGQNESKRGLAAVAAGFPRLANLPAFRAGDGKECPHFRSELAIEAAMTALMKTGHRGRIYNIVGPETLTGGNAAADYGRYIGARIEYGGDDLGAWRRWHAAWSAATLAAM